MSSFGARLFLRTRKFTTWLNRKNDSVQPALGEEVSIEETLDPPLGCNGLSVALRSGVRGVSFTTLRPDLACPRRSSAPIRETSFP